MTSSFIMAAQVVILGVAIALLSIVTNPSQAQLHLLTTNRSSSDSLFPDFSNVSVEVLSENVSLGGNQSSSLSSPSSSLNDVDNYEVASLKQSSAKYFNNGLRHQHPPPEALYGAPPHHLGPVYGHHEKYPPTYLHPAPVYTRVKLGYGTFYYNGHEAELRCQFPHNLHTVSNYVWSKVTDNLVHYLDSYRIYERSYGHTSSLFIRDVMDKDFGVYSCAVSGSAYGTHTVTFYQEVHFYPPQPHTYLRPAYGK